MERALLEMGFIVHPGQCFRTHIPLKVGEDNHIVALTAALGHHFVGSCHLVVDVTNKKYVKNRMCGTGTVSDEALDLIKAFPHQPFERIKRDYPNEYPGNS
jgi:hypothetical protein